MQLLDLLALVAKKKKKQFFFLRFLHQGIA